MVLLRLQLDLNCIIKATCCSGGYYSQFLWKVLSFLNSDVLLNYQNEFRVLSVLVEESLVGWYDGFYNSYLSQEEKEKASQLRLLDG